jgi:long-subunit fatty acid transport protein
VLYGKLDQKAKINNVDPRIGDGGYHVEDSQVGFGGMTGGMVEPWQGTRFGLTYVSPVKLDFEDVLSASDLGRACRCSWIGSARRGTSSISASPCRSR